VNNLKTNNIRPLSGIRASITFFHYVFRIIKLIWPIFSSLLILIMLLGLVTGIREGWTIGNSFYYAFITAFTIGYGDFAPKYPLTKFLAVVTGLVGFLFTGILVAIAVEAMRYTAEDKTSLEETKNKKMNS
jgi:hypothetical protein